LFSFAIENAARKHGFEVKVTTALNDLAESLKERTCSVVIVNLDVVGDLAALSELKGKQVCRFVGYYSHVDGKVAEEAKRAGFDTVLPRRVFVVKLNELLASARLGG
jgi:hypothetical protein